MFGVMELHDLSRDDWLECGIVVGEVRQSVLRPRSVFIEKLVGK